METLKIETDSKEPTVEVSSKNNVNSLKRLIDYAKNYRLQFWLANLCSILNKISSLVSPVTVGAAVDVIVKQEDSFIARLGVKDIFLQLLVLSLATATIRSLESIFEYAQARLWRNLSQRIEDDLRLDSYKHLQQMEMEFFEDRSTGGLMSVVSDDINQLERFLDVGINQILQVTITIIFVMITFLSLAPSVAWMAIIPMPLVGFVSIAFQRGLAPRYAEVREKVDLLNGRLNNNLTGMTTIKSFTAEDYEVERVAAESKAYRESNERAIAVSAAFTPLIRLVIVLSFTGIMVFGGMEVVEGKLSVGIYSTLILLAQQVLLPLVIMGNVLDLYERAMASTARIMNLLDTPLTTPSGKISLPGNKVRGEVEFSNVTFGYRDRPPLLENFSLRVPTGKTIGIAGSTGSGKSTLVKLLLRFYKAQSGSILLDGIELQKLELKDLRRCIGLVSQDLFLFHGTVAENIAYGSFEATEAEIIEAAKVAEAHDYIVQLPEGYQTIVGERGQKLSGGQRQRIAIARAVLKNPPILILDEATSAVDNETEVSIQRSLERITQNRTTIAIAHRLSTIRNADCIYVMEKGKIVEFGQHKDLLANAGVYANLWKVQTG
ncbi:MULTISPECIES: ABC transporter ATP-binding protein [Okeania]|uniref:ABC transporter ATP-binding protein n=1 Tax=Okeania hirsuta TaxID=1458930 RepID=A0A3N6RN99_9CYAN|nr:MULTISPECIES: ABC transporter ATP-binding protein [Okeania]NES88428.1 ABC transporter ATP-binding protein [Okeania sp. SIO2B9]RQH17859.1 ABC transporter ATP-binding protein [Okeania hirsuta]RQH50925.1 ABC transporter ATP-binding protein [Okeania hirsuta]